jgi:3-dehydroquinate synthase
VSSPHQRIPVPLPDRAYDVVVGRGLVGEVASLVPSVSDAARALVVTQAPIVAAGHVEPVEESLRESGIEVHRVVVPDGEGAKRVGVLAGLWEQAASAPLSRADVVVAVGGGVVGDLAGFVAATYNRGIGIVQVPTTLLAQVDAAIGGKTGINLPHGKNLVGAFHQPLGVVCDVDVLSTLPRRTLIEGFGEVVKYGLIRDPEVLTLLEHRLARTEGDVEVTLRDPDLLEDLVRRSAAVKAAVVAADEHEGGERAHLNLGHTYGHAVEALTGYDTVLHGEAVAIGMVAALALGERMGRTPPELRPRVAALLAEIGLPVTSPPLSRDAVWATMARDKKAGADGVRFVVLEEVGRPVVVTPSREDVDAALDGLAAR